MATVATALKKKHVVWISPGFADGTEDDSCIPTLQDLALELKNDPDLRLSIIALHYPSPNKKYVWNGIPVLAQGGNNKKGTARLSLMLQLFRELNRLNHEQKIDVLHSFWMADSAVFPLLWNFFRRKKHLVTVMGQDSLGKVYYRFLPHKKMQLFTLSEFAQKKFLEATGRATVVNPFGLPDFELPKAEKDIDFISVGSIISLKNHLYFLEMMKAIKEQMPSLKALIVGEQHDALELQRLRNFVVENGLNVNISILPKQTRSQVRQLMARSRVLVHCAKFESQGMVKQEALQMACSVFSSATGIQFNHPQYYPLSANLQENIQMMLEVMQQPSENHPVSLIHIRETAAVYKEYYFGGLKIGFSGPEVR